jgi:crotonobetainyl-CoA:carnitine CoA-transferase CaiB-like acyl-CoA transferase
MLVRCGAELVSVTGTPEQPVKAGIPVADITAGMCVFSGVPAALVRRGTTGRGGPVEVPVLEALARGPLLERSRELGGGRGIPCTMRRTTRHSPGAHRARARRHRSVRRLSDGGRGLLPVQNDREWRRPAGQVRGRPEWGTGPAHATDAARVAHRERTDALAGAALGALGTDEAVARPEAAGIACARLRDLHGVAGRPQLAARDRWREMGTPVGPLRTLLPPIDLPGGDEPGLGDVPALGEHTESVLRAVGMTDVEIAALRRDGVAA